MIFNFDKQNSNVTSTGAYNKKTIIYYPKKQTIDLKIQNKNPNENKT